VKAALFALSDPDVKDRDVLERIYGLAIRCRVVLSGLKTRATTKRIIRLRPSVSH
jgi:hypothetical protein